MKKELNKIPAFDDIIFELRNKEYGAFILRKKYKINVVKSMLIGISIMAVITFIPYLNARDLQKHQKQNERQVEITLEHLDKPAETIVPPPPPPPSREDILKQAKYIPPVVVDSVKLEDTLKLMSAAEAQDKVTDVDVVEKVQEVKAESLAEPAKPEPFMWVEEMPEFPGGLAGINKYIAENIIYPEEAKENNIQGKVFVKFCVTVNGATEQVSIIKGVDPALDSEAIRIVKTFPPFKPGKQSGIPVPVWLTVQINFQLM